MQLASIIVLYVHLFGTVIPESGREWCDISDDFEHVTAKMMAIGYTSFLTFVIGVELNKSLKIGFYGILFRAQNESKLNEDYNSVLQLFLKSISYKWLIFGHCVNLITLLNVLVLSFILIFYQSDPLNIILYAVALLFIVNVDEQVIYPSDYDEILEWFEDQPRITIDDNTEIHGFLSCAMRYLTMFSWISILAMILGLTFAIFTAACY